MGRRRHYGPRVTRTFATLALLLTAVGAAAQEPVFKVDVRLVRLLVTVKNLAGELVGSLEARDFAVTDNGVKQDIAVFEHQTTQPLSIALLIDISASTAKDLRYETTSVTKFLEALVREGNPEDAAAFYSFNDQITLLNTYTRNVARIEERLKTLKPDAGTSLYDAIYLAAPALREREGRHVIVAISDGGDTTSSKKYRDALDAAQKADAIFYPIVVVPITNPAGRNTAGEHALETLAASTGGRSFYPTVGAQLDRAFAEILRDLRTQYLLSYYPARVPVGDSSFHTVRVEIPKRRELRISTRSGYYGEVSR
ncbi:MAG: VWA domain-containing protein [Bryobacterales bacterium]|nr:VWA domain-containing protein [Bryobacterales bacterium]